MPSSGDKVTGITILGSDLFVVRCSSQVHVYDSTNFTSSRNIMIPGSQELRGIVSCSHNNCFYASGTEHKIVYRHDLANNTTTQWLVSGTCWGLSVNKRYNLLVLLYDTNKIHEYTTNGILINEIYLESSLAGSKHCVQLSNDNFVVSQDAPLHRICVVDTDGKVTLSYGGSWWTSPLSNPFQLAVDSHDNVLVADCGNNKVKLFSSTLCLFGDIATPGHQLNRPYTFHFDEGNNRLYIGEHTGGRVFVLSVV